MTNNTKSITTIAQVGLVWGLKELRIFLDADPEMKDKVKIIYMKTDTVKTGTLNRFAASLAAYQDRPGSYEIKDSAMTKITAILNEFGIHAESKEGIFVACGGKGDINKGLQNNPTRFNQAQTEASEIQVDEETNFAVFLDNDVKAKLISALHKHATKQQEQSMYNEDPDPLEVFENQAIRDPSQRFALLQQSTKKLQTAVENFATVETNFEKTRQLNYIQKLLETHSFSTIRADQSYQELKDNHSAEKASLENRLTSNKKLLDDMTREMEEIDQNHQAELTEKDTKHAELQAKLRSLEEIKTEDHQEDHAEQVQALISQIKELKDQKDEIVSEYNGQRLYTQETIRRLEDEKANLALQLDKKNRALIRLENQHSEAQENAENVARNLEANELSPLIISKRLSSPEHITPKEKSLPKPFPQAFNLDANPNTSPNNRFTQSGQSPAQTQTPFNLNQRPNQRPIICKPANFGLNTWNPLTTDIYVHLDKALKAGREALNVGATTTSVRRMILNSLGPKCDHVENFIENPDTMTLAKFAEAIGKILGKKSSVQMQSFLTAQRRSGEDLLAYFTRLHMLYRSSNKLTDYTGWEEDPTHSMSFYSKIFDACYQAQKTELIRKTEELLEKGDLTLPKLKGILVEVNKIDASKLSAEEPTIAILNDSKPYQEKSAPKEKTEFENGIDKKKQNEMEDKKNWRKNIVCWHCNTPGHTKLQCFKYIRKMKEEKGYPRETKTRGSSTRDGNPQH